MNNKLIPILIGLGSILDNPEYNKCHQSRIATISESSDSIVLTLYWEIYTIRRQLSIFKSLKTLALKDTPDGIELHDLDFIHDQAIAFSLRGIANDSIILLYFLSWIEKEGHDVYRQKLQEYLGREMVFSINSWKSVQGEFVEKLFNSSLDPRIRPLVRNITRDNNKLVYIKNSSYKVKTRIKPIIDELSNSNSKYSSRVKDMYDHYKYLSQLEHLNYLTMGMRFSPDMKVTLKKSFYDVLIHSATTLRDYLIHLDKSSYQAVTTFLNRILSSP